MNWIGSVINVESAGDVHAKSPKGAMGLMQIMPATWAELRERYNLGNDPYDPHDNILAGTAYLRELLDRYGSPGMFAAYNAGPARYEEHLAGGSLPDETRAYVTKLANLLAIELPPRWTASGQSSAAATLSHEYARSVPGAHAVERCHGCNLGARCFAHGSTASWRVRRSIGFGSIAMTKCAGSQADGVWAMPSARALLVASLLTEPPFGCLGPSGNDRYRKRSEAVGASRVGSQVAVALSGSGDGETTTAGRRDKRGSPVEPQAIGMAWVLACRSVAARAATCILTNAINGASPAPSAPLMVARPRHDRGRQRSPCSARANPQYPRAEAKELHQPGTARGKEGWAHFGSGCGCQAFRGVWTLDVWPRAPCF
ncbi:lytic transglycosylase domain-containing protein [Bradyrhizobium sp. USDA 4459]